MNENQKIVVDIELSQNVLNENKDLNDCYNLKSKQLVYELSGELPKDFIKKLEGFMKDEVVGKNQLSVFNPLIVAVNQLQKLKNLKYDPELSDEDIKKLAEELDVSEIELDEDGDIFFDVLPAKLAELKTPAAIAKYNDKVHKIIVKAFKTGHDDSYQDCKDAIATVGSFNTNLSTAKKVLKAPYSSMSKKIDGIYNAFKQESDNTKEAILLNFVDALAVEQKKKDDAAARRNAAANEKIEELTEANKEQANKLDNQSNAIKIAQVKNAIEYTDIGGISGKMAVECPALTKEALEIKLEVTNALTFNLLVEGKNRDITILNDEEVIELRQKFSENKIQWLAVINREIELRKEKIKSEANAVKLETIKETPTTFGPSSPSFGPISPKVIEEVVVTKEFTLNGTDDENFKAMIDEIERMKLDQENFTKVLKSTVFKDQEYVKRVNALLEQSFPMIHDSYIKVIDWAKKFRDEYLTYLKNQ